MRKNYEIALVGEKIVLVPYRPNHVPKYHEWMKDPHLLETTGSEPLTLKEEVDMQISWKDDLMKCTFIVLDASKCRIDQYPQQVSVKANIECMIGDVNLFLSVIESDEAEEEGSDAAVKTGSSERRIQAEIDVMIAVKHSRGQGLGRAATCSMLLYGIEHLSIERYFCKINEDNTISRQLFESLGFVQCDYAACFKQVELEWLKSEQDMRTVLQNHGLYDTVSCPLVPDGEDAPTV